MKILVVSQYYLPEPFRVNEICEELVKKGNEVTVLAGIPNYPDGEIYSGFEKSYINYEMCNGVKIIRCNNRPRHKGIINLFLNYFSFMLKGCRKIRELEADFDVVYVYQMSPVTMAVPAIRYKKKYQKPLFIYCLDMWPESVVEYKKGRRLSEKGIIFKSVKRLSAGIYNCADKVGISSNSFRDYLVNVCNVSAERISYLPQHSDDISSASKPISRNEDCINLFFMGNIGVAQNVNQIIEAIYEIRNLNNFKINFVGDGSALEEIKEQVGEMGLSDKVVFYGRRPYSEMPLFYKMADACLLTLSAKTKVGLTIPGKLQNYMAAGKPVIASIDGDAADVIRQARCGICVAADDVHALAGAIAEFVNNHDAYIECGANARKYYEENFTLEKHISLLEKNLRSLKDSNEGTGNKC